MLCFMLSLENSKASYLVPDPPREREIVMERKSIENEINIDGTARLLVRAVPWDNVIVEYMGDLALSPWCTHLERSSYHQWIPYINRVSITSTVMVVKAEH